jgi:hypothetical protein
MAHGSTGKLSDFAEARLALSCMLCQRHGESRAEKLITEFGDLTLRELCLPFAASRGCQRATAQLSSAKPYGGICRIRVAVRSLADNLPPRRLGSCYKQGWRLTIRCDSHREGMKSRRPCGIDVGLDVHALVAAFGPDADIGPLGNRLHCPQCGRRGVITFWSLPGDLTGAAAANSHGGVWPVR